MAAIYIIDSTDGSTNFTIKPGELNGSGGVAQDSDLRLYGEGTLKWGEGMDENVYRITESFACEAKTNGDYNPISGLNDYVVGADPLPKDANDLGPNKGINQPVSGQLWYNKALQKIYSYDSTSASSTGWTVVSGIDVSTTTPTIPTNGDLWYDTSLTPPLLKIYDGTAFVVVGSESFVARAGDYMEGTLDMGGPLGSTPNKIINTADPVDPLDVVNLQTITALNSGGTFLSTTNGGPGSGFDADSVDGQHSTDIVLQTQYSDTDVLNKILNVDGTGSGLDADLLDGLDSTDFVTQAIYTDLAVLNKILNVDGAGSGLDADLLDGQDLNFFASGDGAFSANNANALGGLPPASYLGTGIVSASYTSPGFVKFASGLKLNWGLAAAVGGGTIQVQNYFSAFSGILGGTTGLVFGLGGTGSWLIGFPNLAQIQLQADPVIGFSQAYWLVWGV